MNGNDKQASGVSRIDRKIRRVISTVAVVALCLATPLGEPLVAAGHVWIREAALFTVYLMVVSLISKTFQVHRDRDTVVLLILVSIWFIVGGQRDVTFTTLIVFGFAVVIFELAAAIGLAIQGAHVSDSSSLRKSTPKQ